MSEALRNFLFTSESVTEGHPDKIADQISDAVLDEVLKQDPHGRVGCETLVTTGLAVVSGEITTSAQVDYDALVRGTIRGVGYDRAKYGYDAVGNVYQTLDPLGHLTENTYDALNRRTLMLVTQAMMAVLAGVLATLTLQGLTAVWHIYALAACSSAAGAFDLPAQLQRSDT